MTCDHARTEFEGSDLPCADPGCRAGCPGQNLRIMSFGERRGDYVMVPFAPRVVEFERVQLVWHTYTWWAWKRRTS